MTDQITPQEAQQLLDGATPAPWEHYDDDVMISLRAERGAIACDLNEWDADLITAAPRLAATIAADTIEYALEWEDPDYGPTIDGPGEGYWATYEEALSNFLATSRRYPARIVARRVSPIWEVKE